MTGAGPVEVVAPRVNDRRVDEATGERRRFPQLDHPAVGPQVTEGGRGAAVDVSARDELEKIAPALEEFFGSAAGLSASVITRLTTQWQERERFCRRSLAEVDYVYIWVDGIHFNVRLDENRLCALVIVGVRTDGTKELVSISDGQRESTESWADVLRDLRRRGIRAPTVAVGDGALGFWAALRDVFPDTVRSSVLGAQGRQCSQRPAQVRAARERKALAEIRDAEDRDHALAAIGMFKRDYQAKWPKAVAKIVDDTEVLLSFFDYRLNTGFVEDHESDRVDLRHRPVANQGDQGSRLESRRSGHGLYKLIEAAQDRWRSSQCATPRGPGPGRRPLREGGGGSASEQDTEVAA